MQQIRQVLKRKQAQLAKLSKEIELLQQAEEKFREIAFLLAEGEEEEGSLLVEVEDEVAPAVPAAGLTSGPNSKSASASASSPSAAHPPETDKPAALRWP